MKIFKLFVYILQPRKKQVLKFDKQDFFVVNLRFFTIKKMETIKKTFSTLYQNYEIVTCISILEPWEKKIISELNLISEF